MSFAWQLFQVPNRWQHLIHHIIGIEKQVRVCERERERERETTQSAKPHEIELLLRRTKLEDGGYLLLPTCLPTNQVLSTTTTLLDTCQGSIGFCKLRWSDKFCETSMLWLASRLLQHICFGCLNLGGFVYPRLFV